MLNLTRLILLFALGALLPGPAASDDRLNQVRAALSEAGRASPAQWRGLQARLGGDPLWPWLEYARLRQRSARLDADAVIELLRTLPDGPAAEALRGLAVEEFGKRGDWASLQRFDLPGLPGGDTASRCYRLQARLHAGHAPSDVEAALALWDRGEPLPTACDPLIASLRGLGVLDAARVLARIEAAAAQGYAGLMRHMARSLAPELRHAVEAEAAFIERPQAGAAGWRSTPRARAAVEAGLAALAKRDHEAAEQLLDALEGPLSLELERRGRLRAAIALWSAASYLPEAADRLARVPAAAFDERLHEWKVRDALARRDRDAALAALSAMPESLRTAPRWRLVQARLLANSEPVAARTLLESIAGEANFHGFLAADLLDRDYALCPLEPASGRAAEQRLRNHEGLQRALDLFSLDRPGWAQREWNAVVPALPLADQALAVQWALERGWYERAAHTLGSGEGMRYYRQRFPLPHEAVLRREARQHGLEPAWVAALVRAESSWMPAARSPADARGLMQLLPSTAAAVARRLGRPWPGPGVLHDPSTNLALGTAYLRQMLDEHGGRADLASAAYNAGPAAVARWRTQRPRSAPLLDDPALWLETVPFHETREYVARVMAFSLIYDWRMGERAGSLLARLAGKPAAPSRGFTCPKPTVAEPTSAPAAAPDRP
jgi:soluble lytic murein transglycosylase